MTTFLKRDSVPGPTQRPTAPAVFDGPIVNPTLLAYIDQVLVPTLRPDEVVVFDNLTIRKQPEVRAAIERVGATVRYLPPYRPDLNPIEQAFATLKAFLRAARPRSFDDLCTLMRDAIPRYTPTECGRSMRHAGYRLPTRL